MQGKLILLVEDNAKDVALTMRALEKNNIANEIVVARDGSEALDFLFGEGAHAGRDSSILPELVLLDLKMPKMDGIEVLKRIRADSRTDCLPVVILTASDEERDMVQGYRMGANSYILKPVDFARFMDSVKDLGLYWLVLNQVPWRKQASA